MHPYTQFSQWDTSHAPPSRFSLARRYLCGVCPYAEPMQMKLYYLALMENHIENYGKTNCHLFRVHRLHVPIHSTETFTSFGRYK